MAVSKRKCKWCKEYVSQWVNVPAGTFCSIDHALSYAREPKRLENAHRAIHADKVKKVRDGDRSYWLKKAQTAFNAFIRARDKDETCISCHRPNDGSHQRHASHYRSVGSTPELRFEPLNVHASCAQCNNFLSGNLVPYRVNLLVKIGQAKLEWLEGPHDPKRYTIADLKQIEADYKAKLKAIAKT